MCLCTHTQTAGDAVGGRADSYSLRFSVPLQHFPWGGYTCSHWPTYPHSHWNINALPLAQRTCLNGHGLFWELSHGCIDADTYSHGHGLIPPPRNDLTHPHLQLTQWPHPQAHAPHPQTYTWPFMDIATHTVTHPTWGVHSHSCHFFFYPPPLLITSALLTPAGRFFSNLWLMKKCWSQPGHPWDQIFPEQKGVQFMSRIKKRKLNPTDQLLHPFAIILFYISHP